ncbi:MAG: hypothetical protein HY901_17695 [Deltaproteobacteria bacterium]|nr:hypothetical protein [Deltaproteobacteria bacterium]
MSEEKITARIDETPEERAKLLATLQTPSADPPRRGATGAVVGLSLLVVGLAILGAGFLLGSRPTAWAETGLVHWCGGGLCLGGAMVWAVASRHRSRKRTS